MVTHHVMISETVVSLTSKGSRRARVVSKTNQSHGLGKVRFQETESNSTLTVNRNLFLKTQHNGSCLQNGVRQVPLYL